MTELIDETPAAPVPNNNRQQKCVTEYDPDGSGVPDLIGKEEAPLHHEPQGVTTVEGVARRIVSLVTGLPSAALSLLRHPAPAGHTRCGPMTSSAWEGWWHEETAAGPSPRP